MSLFKSYSLHLGLLWGSILLLGSGFTSFLKPSEIFLTNSGQVNFVSEAPLEIISASSAKLTGAFDIEKRTFAFRIPMKSFDGFNDPLQKEHFCEKFLECEKFPYATYKGRLIENLAFEKDGYYQVRTKGMLDIHGVQQERIIPVSLQLKNKSMLAKAEFTVILADHQIKVPQIVFQKIAKEIKVSIEADLRTRNDP